jgi:hypothetical protein
MTYKSARYLIDGERYLIDGERYLIDGGRYLIDGLSTGRRAGRPPERPADAGKALFRAFVAVLTVY